MTVHGYSDLTGWEHPYVNYSNSVRDYDDLDESAWFVVQSDVVRSGDYALKLMPTADFGAAIAPTSWSGEVSGSVRVYFMFGTLPTTGKAEVGWLEWLTDATDLTTKVYYDPADGRLHMHQSTDQAYPEDVNGNNFPLDYTSGQPAVDGPLIGAGHWYLLELRWTDWFEERQTDWRVNGVDYPSIADVKDDQGEPQPMRFFWVGSESSNACTIYVDDLVTTGRAAGDDWPPLVAEFDELYPIGPGYVLAYHPNACGTHNDPSNRLQEDDGSAIDANTWNRLDDVPPNPAGSWDGIKQVAVDAAAYAEFLFEDCREPWPIMALEVLKAGHVLSAGIAKFVLALQFDGDEYLTVAGGANEFDTTVFYKQRGLALDRYGSDSGDFLGPADLTIAKFNALAVRAGYSTDVTPVPALDGLLIQVAFSTENPTVGDSTPREVVMGTPTHTIASSGRTR